MIGSDNANTAKRGSAKPVLFRTRTMPVWRNSSAASAAVSCNRPRVWRAASRNALYAVAGTSSRWPAATDLKGSPGTSASDPE